MKYNASDYNDIKRICEKTNNLLVHFLKDIEKYPAYSKENAINDFKIAINECQSCTRIFFTSNLDDIERENILKEIAAMQKNIYKLKCRINDNFETTIIVCRN